MIQDVCIVLPVYYILYKVYRYNIPGIYENTFDTIEERSIR